MARTSSTCSPWPPRTVRSAGALKANAEASVFRRGRAAHLIDTPAGRIGIGICADNQFAATLAAYARAEADLILMPHAWPTPARAAGLVSQADVAARQQRMTELPVLYARALGVPVVFVNQVGPLLLIGGILGRLMDTRIWRLSGQSRIVDTDGSVLGRLAEDEGVLTADAVMDPARKYYDAQPSFGGWLQPGPWVTSLYHLARHRWRPPVLHDQPPSAAESASRRGTDQRPGRRGRLAPARPASP